MTDNDILNNRANSMMNFRLAEEAFSSQEYKKSLDLATKALESRKISFDNDETKVDESYCNILKLVAQNNYHLSDKDNSLKNLETALNLLEKIYYSGHNRLASILENMACLYEENKDSSKLESTLIRLTEIYEKTVSGEHRNVLNSYLRLANLYFANDKFEDCQKILTKAMKQLDSPLGPIEEFYLLSAKISQKKENYEEAKVSLNKAIFHFEMRQNYSKLKICYEMMLFLEENVNEKSQIQAKIEHYNHLSINIHNADPFSATLLRA